MVILKRPPKSLDGKLQDTKKMSFFEKDSRRILCRKGYPDR